MIPYLRLVRLVGYGLLLLTLFDVISSLISAQFNNPGWQFQTAGEFVERSAVPLIGFIFAFYGDEEARKRTDIALLKLLSWISLIVGVFYLALVVIFFITPPGLNDISQAQVKAQFDSKITQVQQIQAQLEKAQTSEIESLMKSNPTARSATPQAFKAKMLQEAATAEKKLTEQAATSKGDRSMALLKNAVKWGLGALVTGVLFIRIWVATAWVRDWHVD
jgi:hypothetical protein